MENRPKVERACGRGVRLWTQMRNDKMPFLKSPAALCGRRRLVGKQPLIFKNEKPQAVASLGHESK
jgi:hypothetical protein